MYWVLDRDAVYFVGESVWRYGPEDDFVIATSLGRRGLTHVWFTDKTSVS